ncbi:hypothetical protein LSH36_1059g01031 [Paralvinella palmiformis]|uniref:Uncharacterized protein n=1 Tax=Paralvinella palmiformis TaxID=53620 RepID=A0AAD9IW40_9ANNE|nr:hypothetical protein LSH36_1059g01031 [Paralvinella palmiformis]
MQPKQILLIPEYISCLYFSVWITAECHVTAISTDLLNPCSGSQPVSSEQLPDTPQITTSAFRLQIFSNMKTSRDILQSIITTHFVVSQMDISCLYFSVWITAECHVTAISTDLLNPCSGSQPVSSEQLPDTPQITTSAFRLQIFSNMKTSRDILQSIITTHFVFVMKINDVHLLTTSAQPYRKEFIAYKSHLIIRKAAHPRADTSDQ